MDSLPPHSVRTNLVFVLFLSSGGGSPYCLRLVLNAWAQILLSQPPDIACLPRSQLS